MTKVDDKGSVSISCSDIADCGPDIGNFVLNKVREANGPVCGTLLLNYMVGYKISVTDCMETLSFRIKWEKIVQAGDDNGS